MSAERQRGWLWFHCERGVPKDRPCAQTCAAASCCLIYKYIDTYMRRKSTAVAAGAAGDPTPGEGSSPGLCHPVVAGDHRPSQCSTDKGVRSTRWHQSPANT